jgi:hypothetical protein
MIAIAGCVQRILLNPSDEPLYTGMGSAACMDIPVDKTFPDVRKRARRSLR